MKVAICFYGICRSLQYTMPSITRHILNILKKRNIDYRIFCHTYNISNINNSRSGEADVYQIDSQEVFDQEFSDKFLEIKKYGDAWNTNFENTLNLIRQLNSLKIVTKLWQDDDNEYNACLYLRPDLEYLDPININIIEQLISKTIYTPSWHQYPLNDRFAYGTPEAMAVYGNRMDDMLEFCTEPIDNILPACMKYIPQKLWHNKQTRPLHSESLLLYTLNKNNVRRMLMPQRAVRVRANGEKKIKDFG